MNNVTSTVVELWDFLVPPLFKVVIAIGLLAWIAPSVLKGLLSRLRDTAAKVRRDGEAPPWVESLGLEKLVPVVSLFMIVLVIYAANELILGIGWRLPINIVTIQPTSLLHLTTEERLLVLWSQHPGAEFSDLPEALESDLRALTVTHTQEILSNVQYWQKTSAAVTRWFYTAKFLIAFAILLCIVQARHRLEVRRAVGRTLVAVLALTATLVLLTSRMLYCHDQLLSAKYGVLVAALPAKDLPPDAVANLKEKLKKVEMSEGQSSWWEVRILDTYPWMSGVKHLTGESLYTQRKALKKAEPRAPGDAPKAARP